MRARSPQPALPLSPEITRIDSLDVRDAAVQQSLVARIRESDAQAFGIVFDAYFTGLARLAARIVGSRDVAHDVVHDVFLKLWRTRASLSVESSLTAYLYVVTKHAALSAARRAQLEHRWVSEHHEHDAGDGHSVGDDLVDGAPLPDAVAESQDRDEALARAARALPPRCQEALLLKWKEQLTYPEIASVMGTSVKTVERHLGKAFKALRRALKPWADRSM